MEDFKKDFLKKIKSIELLSNKTDECEQDIGKKLETYIKRAREILKKKNAINPKPHKKLMRAIAEDETDEESEKVEFAVPNPPKVKALVSESTPVVPVERESLRPVRSAKLNARSNLKEVATNIKMRNDNNVAVVVKTERISSVNKSNSRDSLKENSHPKVDKEQRNSVDEGVQLSSESEAQSEKEKRSMSVEFVPAKTVEIDLSSDGAEKMPPPPLPVKKKARQKQQKQTPAKQSDVSTVDTEQPVQTRITRSKIKKEKLSVNKTNSAPAPEKANEVTDNQCIQRNTSEIPTVKVNETTNTTVVVKKGKQKKCPMPIIVKVEKLSIDKEELHEQQQETEKHDVSENKNNKFKKSKSVEMPSLPSKAEHINIQEIPINETVTISTNIPVNQTVTLENYNVNETVTLEKNPHDSLMTDDNDEDVSMTVDHPKSSVPQITSKEKTMLAKMQQQQQPLPIKLKKNEVFNPYLSSPVKQKVQAFEKHSTMTTPEVSKTSSTKYNTLKAGTPSKIGVYAPKTTPLNNAKQRYITAISSSASSSSSVTLSSTKSSAKKYTSINQENEEKKKQREEKQQKVQLQREAIEKQKREQTLQQQREREEKFRKIMLEKEEQKRIEALKKKQLKENQEKKYAEEKLKKEEFVVPKEPQSASKDNSLYIKMQKQLMVEKAQQQQKKNLQSDSNVYSFDMLFTDDSTDDESKPSKKRPDPPQWSRKQHRSKLIQIQSYTNSSVLDILFSSQPITVDLRQIFPSIEPRKLVRNSSAVWNTPPRYSQIPKY